VVIQGKQNCTIPQKVYDDLEEQFSKHYLLEGDINTPRPVRFSRVSKKLIKDFLQELKYNKHYENVHLIHYNFTCIKPDDISHIEDKLLNDFDTLTTLYDKRYKNTTTRKSFISTQFVLYQLLTRHKHPCNKSDFNIIKTNDRKAFHDDICENLFRELGWNYDSFF